MYGAPVIRNIGSYKRAFDVGSKRNWVQVFGTNPIKFFLPVPVENKNPDNGHVFPLNPTLRTNSMLDDI